MSADFTPEKEDYKILTPFKMQVLTNFPYIEADFDALTNYQLLCKVVEYLNGVIHNENEVTEQVNSLYNAYVSLQNYVNTYFDNLDLQEEVDNKLDEMAESGQLTDIIAQYLGLAGMITFNNVSEMKLAENIVNGSKCCTLGYYNVNDGGSATYKIRTITNDDVVDEMFIIELADDSLIAELIIDNHTINLKQLGSKNNGTNDDTTYIENALTKSETKKLNIIIPDGTTLISKTLSIPTNTSLIGLNDSKIKATSTFTPVNTYKTMFKNKNSIMDHSEDSNITIKNITFESTNEDNGHDGLIQFRGVKNSRIENCDFIVNGNNSWGIILFSANKNIEINNINIDNISSDNSLGGCLWIRGGLAYSDDNSKSYGIHVTNSNFTSTAKDECVCIADGVNGAWVEAQIDNCNIIGKAVTNLPSFLMVLNAIGSNSYLKANVSNINISGKAGLFAMVIGHTGIPLSCTYFTINNLNIDMSTGGGTRAYNKAYIIANSNIKVSSSDKCCYNGTIVNSFLNRYAENARLINDTIITETGRGAEQCTIIKDCYIETATDCIHSYNSYTAEILNNHLISTSGNGIFCQPNGSDGIIDSIIGGNFIERKEANDNTGLSGINIQYGKRCALVNNRIFGTQDNTAGNYKGYNYGVNSNHGTSISTTENNITYISV